ncbi:MAG: hypothetical protein HXY42_05720 [Chloroflexi bacterium]|nr:hypothetical protein [Chloroflexota bacterium]
MDDRQPARINRGTFLIFSSFEEADREEKAYWLSQSPYERLQHVELLRRINYGANATARLQRVLEITERT